MKPTKHYYGGKNTGEEGVGGTCSTILSTSNLAWFQAFSVL